MMYFFSVLSKLKVNKNSGADGRLHGVAVTILIILMRFLGHVGWWVEGGCAFGWWASSWGRGMVLVGSSGGRVMRGGQCLLVFLGRMM
jgi:hypothetical protein